MRFSHTDRILDDLLMDSHVQQYLLPLESWQQIKNPNPLHYEQAIETSLMSMRLACLEQMDRSQVREVGEVALLQDTKNLSKAYRYWLNHGAPCSKRAEYLPPLPQDTPLGEGLDRKVVRPEQWELLDRYPRRQVAYGVKAVEALTNGEAVQDPQMATIGQAVLLGSLLVQARGYEPAHRHSHIRENYMGDTLLFEHIPACLGSCPEVFKYQHT